MSKEKAYLTIEQQIKHLKSKGLEIKHETLAKRYLGEIGYYKLINGYREPFIVKICEGQQEYTKFIEETSIDELYELYRFDHALQSLLLRYITEIEINIKARLSEVISSKYGIKETEYLCKKNFKKDDEVHIKFYQLKREILKTLRNQQDKQASIVWYYKNYGFYPFWIISNVLPLGTISLVYLKMKQPDQYLISHYFGIKPKLMESSLSVLTLFRNACAHNERVYNFNTRHFIAHGDLKNIYEFLGIEKSLTTNRYIKGQNDVLSVIIIFKLLLSKSQYSEFIDQYFSLIKKFKEKFREQMYSNIMKSMGIVFEIKKLKELQKIKSSN